MGPRSAQPEKSSSTRSDRYLLALWMRVAELKWGEMGWGGGVRSHGDQEDSRLNCFHRGWMEASQRSVCARTEEKRNVFQRSPLNTHKTRIQKEILFYSQLW